MSPHPRAVVTLSAILAAATTAAAGVPDPARLAGGIPCEPALRSSWAIAPGPLPCQHRFRADGTLDALRVVLTLRDCFDAPVPGCEVQATIAPGGSSPAFCACEPASRVTVTDGVGAAEFVFRRIGGRGSGRVLLTLLCLGPNDGGFPALPFAFTSPDQDGSCESGASTTVIDLALWAFGLSSYRRESDFDCTGTVNVVDLGLWAGGLGRGCGP